MNTEQRTGRATDRCCRCGREWTDEVTKEHLAMNPPGDCKHDAVWKEAWRWAESIEKSVARSWDRPDVNDYVYAVEELLRPLLERLPAAILEALEIGGKKDGQ